MPLERLLWLQSRTRCGSELPPHEAAAIIAGYAVPRFIYFDPDSDVSDFLRVHAGSTSNHDNQTKKGTFLSLIIQETLTAHMAAVIDADRSFGRPVGALALCCAAVGVFCLRFRVAHLRLQIERALNGWKDGVNRIEENKKDTQLNRQTAFKADRWGPVAVR